MSEYITEQRPYNHALVNEFFLGRRIVATDYTVAGEVKYLLDNGVKILLVPNEGCSCGQGVFTLTDYSKFDHVITRVSLKDDGGDSYGDRQGVIELFVYGEGITSRIAEVKGHEGNGHYGRGFTLHVIQTL